MRGIWNILTWIDFLAVIGCMITRKYHLSPLHKEVLKNQLWCNGALKVEGNIPLGILSLVGYVLLNKTTHSDIKIPYEFQDFNSENVYGLKMSSLKTQF